jgi:autotransporter-associated beta strand protein
MNRFRPASFFCAVVLCALSTTSVRAQNWVGGGSTPYSWNDTANWSGGSIPNSTAGTATFSDPTNPNNANPFTVNLPTNISLQSMSFNANQTGAVTLATTGGSMTLSTNGNQNAFVVAAGSGDHTINVDCFIGGSNNAASRLWSVGGSATLTVNGVIGQVSNSRAVGKTGTGTLILTGNNTFTGGFNATVGTTYVNNSVGSGTGTGAVAVTSGATLGGTGTIAGALTVSGVAGTPGILSPGGVSSPGTLTVANNVTLGSNTQLSVRLSGATDGTYDRLNTTGNVILTGSTLTASVIGGYTPTFGDKLFIIVNSGSGTTTGTFNGLAEGATVPIGAFNFTIHYGANFEAAGQPLTGGNDVALTPVPEPAAVLGLAAIGGLAVRLRRRFGV